MEAPFLMTKTFASDSDYFPVKSFKEAKSVLWTETVVLWKIAVPVALTSLFQFLSGSSTTIYAGHLGDTELSSISVYSSVMAPIYFALLWQNCSLGCQLHWELFVGKLMEQGKFNLLEFTCKGQANDIAELAGQYSILSIPSMFSFAINLSTQRFLQVQSKVSVIMFIAIIALIINNGLLYLFICVFSWGTMGAAMASNVSSWIIAGGQVIYAVGWCKEAWNGLSWLAFKDLWGFTRLTLASSLMLCLEQWYTPCILLLAGHLHNPAIALGSYSICLNFSGWQLMLLLGLNAAVSVRVSNKLGMRHPRAAEYSFMVTIFYSLLLGMVLMIAIFLNKDNIAIIFTNSKDMQLAVADLAYLLGLTMIINSVAQVLSGVAIGSGWQVKVAYINLACYYIVGLPFGFLLGFTANSGVKGLWGGTMCGSTLQILILLSIILKTNWNKEVEQTAKRMQICDSHTDTVKP
ncbi:Multi antimicrobial extrusion protein [Sesbania bispinosa]|nr:Multi antimicrobial extrusion protein [Sesbania bispinosa]